MTNNRKARIVFVVAVVLTAATALIAPLQASSLRNGQTGTGATVSGSLPGEVFWTYYDTTQSATACSSTTSGICDAGGNGDNILRLINPNGNANPTFGAVEDVCAMIYVFDDAQEMGECCGCPLSPAGFESFSVEHDLTSNWIFGNNPDGNTVGAIAIAVTGGNVDFIPNGQSPSNGHNCAVSQSAACNGGCDPTTQPGYSVSTANNLLGGITHNETVGNDGSAVSGLTEVPLFDNASGDPNNLIYLQNQCASLVGGGSGAGFCHCPEIPSPPTSPTPTATPTATATATETPTPTPTATATSTPTATPTPTTTPTLSVTQCGQILDVAGAEYVLTGDLECPCGSLSPGEVAPAALTIEASDIHLNTAGFTVSSVCAVVAISNGLSNVQIDGGGYLTGGDGLVIGADDHVIVNDMNLSGDPDLGGSGSGVDIQGANYVSVTNSSTNGSWGIIGNTDYSTFADNQINLVEGLTDQIRIGIWSSGQDNLVENNTVIITGSGLLPLIGISIGSSTTVTGNTVSGFHLGMELLGQSNTVLNNTVIGTGSITPAPGGVPDIPYDGIVAEIGAIDNSIEDNTVSGNVYGYDLYDYNGPPCQNTWEDNTFTTSGGAVACIH